MTIKYLDIQVAKCGIKCFKLTDIDDCESISCKNGGTCTDGVSSYTCYCVIGYSGTHCEIGESYYLCNC